MRAQVDSAVSIAFITEKWGGHYLVEEPLSKRIVTRPQLDARRHVPLRAIVHRFRHGLFGFGAKPNWLSRWHGTGQFQWRNPKLQFSRLKPCPLWSSPEGKWRCTVAKFEIRRIVRELKKQRCQIEQAIVALEGVEKRPLKRYARKARPRLQALPSIQLQSERKGQLVPFIRPAIVG